MTNLIIHLVPPKLLLHALREVVKALFVVEVELLLKQLLLILELLA